MLTASRTRRGVLSSEMPRAGLSSAAGHAITPTPRLRGSPRCAVAPTGRLLTIEAGGSQRSGEAGEAKLSLTRPGVEEKH